MMLKGTSDSCLLTPDSFFFADKVAMTTVAEIMTKDVVLINMDTPLGQAMEACSDKRIRHIPVVDENQKIVGLITDRDLRSFISPRIGTISENNSDRQNLRRPVHLIMLREVVTANPEMSIADAARSMIEHRVGCLPVVDPELHVVGLITTTDLLRYISEQRS
jgi:CBS domain-containing protein